MNTESRDPITNLTKRPVRGILKSAKSVDEVRMENNDENSSSSDKFPITSLTRCDSKCHKTPHFDEMNIIATYHPVDKDYGHMKIEEPKTPYTKCDHIDEDMDVESNTNDTVYTGVDPNALVQRLNESSIDSIHTTTSTTNHSKRRSYDDASSEDFEHRKQFERQRKQHYNEFEVVRLYKNEIDAELRALEREDTNEIEIERQNIEITDLSSSTSSRLHMDN